MYGFNIGGDFNPRSREGSDGTAEGYNKSIEVISIHAPAKGATLRGQYDAGNRIYFNPRSREGSDWIGPTQGQLDPVFQSTLPRRERRSLASALLVAVIFQSTLPRRERRGCGATSNMTRKFQSTLPRRERRIFYGLWMLQNDFNPRSREGSDDVEKVKGAQEELFQSTLPRRERQ